MRNNKTSKIAVVHDSCTLKHIFDAISLAPQLCQCVLESLRFNISVCENINTLEQNSHLFSDYMY